MTERWLEASQALHGELQTVHVRTQTLGQGMKVVLGWVEGMADKVTGLQGAQHRMAQQVASQREEQQFALNATARETISKVKGMLGTQAAAALLRVVLPMLSVLRFVVGAEWLLDERCSFPPRGERKFCRDRELALRPTSPVLISRSNTRKVFVLD